MAEIEMDVDYGRTFGQADEDLIDFDMDMHDEHEPAAPHDDQNEPHPTEAIVDMDEIDIDVEHGDEHLEHGVDAEMSEEADLDEVEEAMHDVDQTEHDAGSTVEYENHAVEDQEDKPDQQGQETGSDLAGTSQNLNEAPQQTRNLDESAENTHESDNEIDYETEEQPTQLDQPERHGSLETSDLEDKNGQTLAEIHDTDDHAIQNEGSDLVDKEVIADLEDTKSNRSDAQNGEEEEEITYDEGDDHVPEATSAQSDEVAPTGSAEAITNDELAETQLNDEDGGVEEDKGSPSEFEDQAATQNDGVEDANVHEYDATAELDEEHVDEYGDDREDEHGEERSYNQLAHESENEPLASDHNSIALSDEFFPAITVQYKGDEFPLFSNDSNGFFTEISVLDKTVDKLLSGFREELTNEICHEDELVFRVDELGLEFSESSGSDSLSTVTLREILDIFDLLVKNQDPDSSRPLYTYLFTKPCATKRLEFLIESAAAGKGLDEVIHLFESPVQATAGLLDTNTADDDLDENSELYESLADEKEESKEKSELDAQPAADDADTSSPPIHHGIGEDEEGNQDPNEPEHSEGGNAEPDQLDVLPTQHDVSDEIDLEEQHDTSAHDESESNPFLNLELDDEADEEEVDLGCDGLLEAEQVDPNTADADTINSSTTATLKDEDENSSLIIETSTHVAATESKDVDDELGEIDWRDEHEKQDEALSPQSPPGKRAREDDDDIDAGDEQDVKRRRP